MTGAVILILRILLVLCMYGFLAWALWSIWRDLRAQGHLISAPVIPALSLTRVDLVEGEEASAQIFQEPEVVIGRSANVELSISDDTVSARHARLSFHHNQWWVEDLHSTNGTFLNDERVSVPTVIVAGDELRCGQVCLIIGIEEKSRSSWMSAQAG